MVGGRTLLRGAILVATGGASAPVAEASAWAIAEGVTQTIATVSRETGDFGQSWRADDYAEYGLGDGWASSVS